MGKRDSAFVLHVTAAFAFSASFMALAFPVLSVSDASCVGPGRLSSPGTTTAKPPSAAKAATTGSAGATGTPMTGR